MVTPFLYPKSIHRRKFSPPTFSRYQNYKPLLQEEFYGQCVYCRLPDSLKGDDSFGVDHYRPKKRFPHLSTEYLNLFYSCNSCNTKKGQYWPTTKQLAAGQLIPNPCEYVMFDHIRYKGAEVAAHSESGKWTVEMLDLNDPKLLEYRRDVIGIIVEISNGLGKSRQTLTEIKSQLRIVTEASRSAYLESEKNLAEIRISDLEKMLKRVSGQKYM